MIITVWVGENGLVGGSQQGTTSETTDADGRTAHQVEAAGLVPPDVYQYADGELTPASPAVLDAAFLERDRKASLAQLQGETHAFVERKPDGTDRYDYQWQLKALSINPADLDTQAQRDAWSAALAWIETVWGYYATIKAAINAATTLTELAAASWDFSPFEVSSGTEYADPDISLTGDILGLPA